MTMADIIFYEKPGCAGNTRQKRLLIQAGHRLEVRNLLTEPWTAERLQAFFGDLPVAKWFNLAAPRVKSGEVQPAALTAEQALRLMLNEPLLIRRPLMERHQAGEPLRMAGFDITTVNAWIGPGHGVLTSAQSLDGCADSQPGGLLNQCKYGEPPLGPARLPR